MENNLQESKARRFTNHNDQNAEEIKIRPRSLPCKQFKARNSPLTDLCEMKQGCTIYHICIAVLIGLFLHNAASDSLSEGRSKFGFNLIFKGFAQFHVAIIIWICMFAMHLAIFWSFKFWTKVRTRLILKSFELKMWDRLCIGMFISFYPFFMYFCTTVVTKYQLSIALSLAILMEMARFLMKSHAFVRSNAPRALKYKLNAGDQILCPEASQFLYFSFAPTLVYEDNYPRSKHVRWRYVTLCFLEVFAAVLFMSLLLEEFYIPTYGDYGKGPHTWQEVVITILGNVVPAAFVILALFYLLLHLWQNAFAEMLRFSDRLFYEDWWTSATYGRFYRTWNIVVHEWLYAYVYKDFYEIVLPKNKIAAKLMVFFVSAFFHEYIIGFALRFCFPALFVQFFGAGVAVSYLKFKNDSVGNVFLWYTFALGCSININLYWMEYYFRQNCPVRNATFANYFIPYLLTCNK